MGRKKKSNLHNRVENIHGLVTEVFMLHAYVENIHGCVNRGNLKRKKNHE